MATIIALLLALGYVGLQTARKIEIAARAEALDGLARLESESRLALSGLRG